MNAMSLYWGFIENRIKEYILYAARDTAEGPQAWGIGWIILKGTSDNTYLKKWELLLLRTGWEKIINSSVVRRRNVNLQSFFLILTTHFEQAGHPRY
jgi:hypothetical protein